MQVNATITQSTGNSIMCQQITESVIDSYLHVEPTRFIFYGFTTMFIIFGLKSIIKQLLNLVYGFLHWKCIIKQLLDSVFVIRKMINASVTVIILVFGSANNSYLDIDNFHITINLIQ